MWTNIIKNVDKNTPADTYRFMYNDYPNLACFDTDAIEFKKKRHNISIKTKSGAETEVSMDLPSRPDCWFAPCMMSGYTHTPGTDIPDCTSAVAICTQDNSINNSNISATNLNIASDQNCQAIANRDENMVSLYFLQENASVGDQSIVLNSIAGLKHGDFLKIGNQVVKILRFEEYDTVV